MVGRFDLGHRAGHRLVDITDVLRDHARLECRLFKLGQEVLGGKLSMRTVVPFDGQGRETFLCGSHVIGYDRNFFARWLNPSNSFILVMAYNSSFNLSEKGGMDFRNANPKFGHPNTRNGPIKGVPGCQGPLR